jgi:poly(3-hydroxyalkanoate) synthetase
LEEWDMRAPSQGATTTNMPIITYKNAKIMQDQNMLQLFTMLHDLILVFNEDVKTYLKLEENV